MRTRTAATWVLVFVGVIAIGMAIRALFVAGIGWDSLFETQASLITRAIDPASTLTQAYAAAPITTEYYGMLLYQITDTLHLLLTGSREWLSPDDPTTYVWQGLVNIAFLGGAAAALGLAVARALASRLAGAFAWATLLTTPLWLGMSFVDVKDMTVATGLTLVSSGLILSWTIDGRLRPSMVGATLAGIGGSIALGTRAGAVLLIVGIAGGTFVAFAVAAVAMRKPQRLIPVATTAAASVLLPALVVWLTNPFAHIDLVTWLRDSVLVSRQYGWIGTIRMNGIEVPSDDLPWWYVPVWLLVQLPLLTTAAAAMGAFFVAASLIRSRWGVGRGQLLALTPIAIQGVVLPIGIVAMGAILYDGLRHVLFIIPAVVTLGAIGVAALERGWQERGGRAQTIAPAIAVLIVGASLFADLRWFPYMYAYINPIAGSNKTVHNWELDYWGVTAREGIARLQESGYASVAVTPDVSSSRIYGGMTPSEVAALPPATSGVYAFYRGYARIDGARCARTFVIERDGLALGEGGFCQ